MSAAVCRDGKQGVWRLDAERFDNGVPVGVKSAGKGVFRLLPTGESKQDEEIDNCLFSWLSSQMVVALKEENVPKGVSFQGTFSGGWWV